MWLYQFAIYGLKLYLNIWGYFSPKIRDWNTERKNHLRSIHNMDFKGKKVIWMHCSSLGEYEQGSPIFNQLKKNQPQYYFLLTLFSPSAYTILKYKEVADHVMYLPIDTKVNAKTMVDLVNPAVFIGVKYDFWWNLFSSLQKMNCLTFYIALAVNNKSYFLKPFFRKQMIILQKFTQLYTIDHPSFRLLMANEFKNVELGGDPRVDRVIERSNQIKNEDNSTLIKDMICYGSIYQSDLPIIIEAILSRKDIIHILVPHEVDPKNVDLIRNNIGLEIAYVTSPETLPNNCQIGIVTEVGHLMQWYAQAKAAYIGGCYEKGIHNTLEPASFGIPISIGPITKDFIEVQILEKTSLLKKIDNAKEFSIWIDQALMSDSVENIRIAQTFFDENGGKSVEISKSLAKYLI